MLRSAIQQLEVMVTDPVQRVVSARQLGVRRYNGSGSRSFGQVVRPFCLVKGIESLLYGSRFAMAAREDVEREDEQESTRHGHALSNRSCRWHRPSTSMCAVPQCPCHAELIENTYRHAGWISHARSRAHVLTCSRAQSAHLLADHSFWQVYRIEI
jgi:hypothetical protein